MSYEAAIVIPAYNEQKLIGRTLGAIAALNNPTERPIPLVIVDNASTDETCAVVESYRNSDGPDIHLIPERERGLGYAVDTGFRYAIEELGVDFIARVDADTIPVPNWFSALHSRHRNNPSTHLLTGPVFRADDGEDRLRDKLILDLFHPPIRKAQYVCRAIRRGSLGMLRFAPGHNMSTTSEAYMETGGFPRAGSSIANEDVVYNSLISRIYGSQAMGYEQEMAVFTSPRRIHAMGYVRYFIHHHSPQAQRALSSEIVDYR